MGVFGFKASGGGCSWGSDREELHGFEREVRSTREVKAETETETKEMVMEEERDERGKTIGFVSYILGSLDWLVSFR